MSSTLPQTLPIASQQGMDQLPAPELLAELTPQQFQLWLRHPVTELLLQRYFPDFRHTLERMVLNSWEAGTVTLAAENHYKGLILAAATMSDITLDAVRHAYGLAPWAEAEAAKGGRR